MKLFPFIRSSQALVLLRITVALFLMLHGIIRLYAGTVNEFRGFLDYKGFPAGVIIAWALTLFEIGGGILLILGYFVRWVAAIWIIELIMGIILVHAGNGWFVVGYQSGGAEYSMLLIIVLLTVAATAKERA